MIDYNVKPEEAIRPLGMGIIVKKWLPRGTICVATSRQAVFCRDGEVFSTSRPHTAKQLNNKQDDDSSATKS